MSTYSDRLAAITRQLALADYCIGTAKRLNDNDGAAPAGLDNLILAVEQLAAAVANLDDRLRAEEKIMTE
jgi:hypothetical protein